MKPDYNINNKLFSNTKNTCLRCEYRNTITCDEGRKYYNVCMLDKNRLYNKSSGKFDVMMPIPRNHYKCKHFCKKQSNSLNELAI